MAENRQHDRRMTDQREHCEHHENLCSDHESLDKAVAEIRAERRTERYMFGGLWVLVVGIIAVCTWVFQDTLSQVRNELSGIKTYISSGAATDAATRVEIENVKFRLQQIESELLTRRK